MCKVGEGVGSEGGGVVTILLWRYSGGSRISNISDAKGGLKVISEPSHRGSTRPEYYSCVVVVGHKWDRARYVRWLHRVFFLN